jgi:transcription elongation factor GreA
MEADPAQGRLSAESPVGQALRNREVGESILIETPGGKKSYRLQKLLD